MLGEIGISIAIIAFATLLELLHKENEEEKNVFENY